MAELENSNLWSEYNLVNNPDIGGGVLYALRYGEDHLAAMRKSVVNAIERHGASLTEHPEGIEVILAEDIDDQLMGRLAILFEELTVINEASEYQAIGFGQFDTIPELARGITGAIAGGDGGEAPTLGQILSGDKAEYYNFVTVGVCELIGELAAANALFGIPSDRDMRAFKSTSSAAHFSQSLMEGKSRPGILLGA